MHAPLTIVADFDSTSKSHLATNEAISHSAAALGITLAPRWTGTAELAESDGLKRLGDFPGIWIGSGSPYASMDGALAAIRYARERGVPLLGTCGGFQHIILEYARNVLGFAAAEHEETAPQASTLLISRLACSLVGRTMTIDVAPNSKLASIYGRTTVQEEYLCNFGVNPEHEQALRSGTTSAGRVRRRRRNSRSRIAGPPVLHRHIIFAAAPIDPVATTSADYSIFEGVPGAMKGGLRCPSHAPRSFFL